MRGRMNPKNKFAAALIMLLCMAMLFATPAFAAAEGTAPVALSGAVTDKGDISILFDQAVADPAGTQGQFTVKVDEIEVAVDSVGTTNTEGKIKLVLMTKASTAQKVVVTYTKSEETTLQIKSTTGLPVESFVLQFGPAAVVSGEVTTQGDVSITFDQEMTVPDGSEVQFAVTVDDVPVNITDAVSASNLTKVKLVLETKADATQTVAITYTKSDDPVLQIKSTAGLPVENYTLQFGPPTVLSGEVTTKGDVSILFDQAMSDPTGTHGQFSVTVNEAPVTVTKVEATNTEGKIKLVLESKAAVTQKVVVNYTKSDDTALQIKTLGGLAMESFRLQFGPPTALSGEVTTKGDVSILFDQAISDPTGTHGQFAVTVNEAPVTVTKVEATNTEGKIKLVINPTATVGQLVNITYTKNTDPAMQIKSVSGLAAESFELQIGQPAAPPVLTPDTSDNKVGKTIDITFEPDEDWTCKITNVKVNDVSIRDKYTIGDSSISILTEVFPVAGNYNILVRATAYEDAVVTQSILSSGSSGGNDSSSGDGSGSGDGDGAGTGTPGDLTVDFTAVKTSPSDTVLHLDFNKGMDDNLAASLALIKVYEKTSKNEVTWSDYEYVKSGNTDTGDKVRRLVLNFNDLKGSTSYVIELGAGVMSNNGSTLGVVTKHEFSTSSASSTGSIISGIDSQGGTVKGEGMTLEIPPLALPESAKISLEKVSDISGTPIESNNQLVGNVVRIDSDKDDDFLKPVNVTMEYDPAKVDLDKYDLGLYYFDEKTKEWISLQNVKLDLANGKISGETTKMGDYAVIASLKAIAEQPQTPAEQPAVQLSDIADHWAKGSIEELVGIGAISGYPDGSFAPDKGISRAEFAVVLVKALQLEAKEGKVFIDTEEHWAKVAIATAYAYGIISGYDDSTFGPDDIITREQMAVMIMKAAKLQAGTGELGFTDRDQISSWAEDAIAAAVQNQLISGYPDNTFRPSQGASRAEAVTVILKALQLAA